MIDVEALIGSELERMLPLPVGRRASWNDVLDRAGHHRRVRAKRRALALVAAAAAVTLIAVTTPVGAAVLDGVGGFAAWIAGRPGAPASPAEQQAFQQANKRSWSGFAPGTELRRLIETTVGGTSYTLYGFRSGDELCLRLTASTVSVPSTHCAPVSALQTAKRPALVVAADEPFGTTNEPPNAQGYVPPAASASFGIASDGVSQVVLHADDGSHDALVASNAFLYVADHPQASVRVRSVDAIAGDGAKVALPFESAPYGTIDLAQPPTGSPQGPAHIEREVSGGTIGWLQQQNPDGMPLPDELKQTPMLHDLIFGRLLQPDPQSSDRIALELVGSIPAPPSAPTQPGPLLCTTLVGGGGTGLSGGCGPFANFFKHSPMHVGMSSSGSDQFSLLDGIVSDDIAKVTIFLASGQTVDPPVSDNVFLARVARAAFPIRVVGYDNQQRVIAIQTFQDDGMTNPAPPAARKSIRERFRVTAADGTTAIVSAGDPAGGYRCWSISYGNGGAQEGGCTPWPLTNKLTKGNPLLLIGATRTGDDIFLGGQVPADVASVTVTYTDGTTDHATTQDGYAVYAIPGSRLASGGTTVALRAYDAQGTLLAQRGLTTRR